MSKNTSSVQNQESSFSGTSPARSGGNLEGMGSSFKMRPNEFHPGLSLPVQDLGLPYQSLANTSFTSASTLSPGQEDVWKKGPTSSPIYMQSQSSTSPGTGIKTATSSSRTLYQPFNSSVFGHTVGGLIRTNFGEDDNDNDQTLPMSPNLTTRPTDATVGGISKSSNEELWADGIDYDNIGTHLTSHNPVHTAQHNALQHQNESQIFSQQQIHHQQHQHQPDHSNMIYDNRFEKAAQGGSQRQYMSHTRRA